MIAAPVCCSCSWFCNLWIFSGFPSRQWSVIEPTLNLKNEFASFGRSIPAEQSLLRRRQARVVFTNWLSSIDTTKSGTYLRQPTLHQHAACESWKSGGGWELMVLSSRKPDAIITALH